MDTIYGSFEIYLIKVGSVLNDCQFTPVQRAGNDRLSIKFTPALALYQPNDTETAFPLKLKLGASIL
jgi:hypothetical protein